jgi:hypothetical protein
VLPTDCDGVESRKTFVLYIRRGGQKVNTFTKQQTNCVKYDEVD